MFKNSYMKLVHVIFQILVVLITPVITDSQNLVPNPSFEDLINCPDAAGNIEDDLMVWKSSRGTPDYFHSCATDFLLSVPTNFAGFQAPVEGNGYIGLWTYSKNNPASATESISVELIDPLTLGEKYFISFNYSLTFGTQGHNYSHNKIGIQLSTEEYFINNPSPINNFTHLETSEIPIDSSIWIPVMGSFIADSPYSYLNLGNFYEPMFVDTIGLEEENFRAYYYFDNICVSTDSIECNLINNIININPSILVKIYFDSNGILNIINNSPNKLSTIELYNVRGQKIYSSFNLSGNIQTVDLSSIPPQILIGIVQTQNSIFTYKLIKQ